MLYFQNWTVLTPLINDKTIERLPVVHANIMQVASLTSRAPVELWAHHTGIQDVPTMVTYTVVRVPVTHLHTTRALLSSQTGPIEQLDLSLMTDCA